jgi:hypothetical protein
VVGGRVEYFPDPTAGMRAYADWLNSLVTVEASQRDLWIECPLPGPGLTTRAELVSYRDQGWPEDYDLVLRISEGGGRFRNVDALVHRWRDHPQRLTRTQPAYTLDAFRSCKVHFLRRTLLAGGRAAVVWARARPGRRSRVSSSPRARRSLPSSRSTRASWASGSTGPWSSPSSARPTFRAPLLSARCPGQRGGRACGSSRPDSA